jgi:hypothetical protein
MKTKLALVLTPLLLAGWGCDGPLGSSASNGNAAISTGREIWLIPQEDVYEGGPGKDGIPALTEPDMVPVSQALYLAPEDVVIGVEYEGQTRAYPHSILNWHEIVNDRIGDLALAVTYCPLTGSGMGWDRNVTGHVTTFGVSGLLYNSNLIPYDRATDSYWSQMGERAVRGELSGQRPVSHPVIETTWNTWKKIAPDTRVLDYHTGYSRPYERYPYGDYKENHDRLLFPVSHQDSRLRQKERVLAVREGGSIKAYQIGGFGDRIQVINDMVGGEPVVVIGSQALNLVVAYLRRDDEGNILTFTSHTSEFPVVMTDQQGQAWDVLGRAVGSEKRLSPAHGFIAFWFAFAAFHPDIEIYSF